MYSTYSFHQYHKARTSIQKIEGTEELEMLTIIFSHVLNFSEKIKSYLMQMKLYIPNNYHNVGCQLTCCIPENKMSSLHNVAKIYPLFLYNKNKKRTNTIKLIIRSEAYLTFYNNYFHFLSKLLN